MSIITIIAKLNSIRAYPERYSPRKAIVHQNSKYNIPRRAKSLVNRETFENFTRAKNI